MGRSGFLKLRGLGCRCQIEMDSTETLSDEMPRTIDRRERLEELSRLIAEGEYVVPAIDIAHAILHGRPKWGKRVPRPGDLRSLH